MNLRRVVVEFGKDDLETLLRWSTSSLASVRCCVRANMVLMAAAGFSDSAIAQELDVGAPRVRRWVARYVKLGLAGIQKDAPRGGRPRQVSVQRVIELTTQTQPEAATHWSTRTMAKQAGASKHATPHQEPVGLGNRRLQIDRSGPFFTVFLVTT